MTAAEDPHVLLRWMRARTGDIPMRSITDAGPRPFRRRPAADAALALLIEAGLVVDVSSRPRAFRVTDRLPMVEDVRHRLDAELADRSDLPADAQLYVAAADVKAAIVRQLGHHCHECEKISQKVDDLVMAALGCDPGDGVDP